MSDERRKEREAQPSTAIKDAIYHLKEALTGPDKWRMSELENAQEAIKDAIRGE